MAGSGCPRGIRVVVLAAALAAGLAALPANADAASARRAGAAVSERVGSDPASIRSYWTAARMRAARPVRLLAPRAGAAVRRSHQKRRAPRTRAPGRRLGVATRVAHAARQPTRAHGKVFFSAGAFDYQCSGTAVKAPSRSLVLTAGHCAYFLLVPGLRNAVRDWVFVPAYNRGRAPFGKWPATKLAAPAGWVASEPLAPAGDVVTGDSRYDVGAATVARRRGGTLQRAVGAVGTHFDRPRHRRYEAFGYPALAPFNGQREFVCDSPYRGGDPTYDPPRPIRISCDMTAGASGGGWVDGRGRIVSVTSYGYAGDSHSLYGPYFGAAIHSFYRSVRNG